jgi:LysM repeat protein
MRQGCVILALGFFLAACSQGGPLPSPPALLPMPSATPSPAFAAPRATSTPPPTFTPTATSTPVTYVIQKGDTLGGIAYRFGISVDTLQAANPKVQPAFLTIGTVLTIPVTAGGPSTPMAPVASPTPWPVALAAGPVCYPLVTGALYCFVEARNPGSSTLRNVIVQMVLIGPKGQALAGQAAAAALDVIPPGGSSPVGVWFPQAPPGLTAPVVQVLAAESLPAAETPAAVPLDVATAGNLTMGIGAGAPVTMTGQARNSSAAAVSTVKLVLTLYGSDGKILNFREAALAGSLAAGASRDYSISAASLGGAVDHAAVVAEGTP